MREYGLFYLAALCTVINLFTAVLKEVRVNAAAGLLALLAGLCGALFIYWSLYALYRDGRLSNYGGALRTTALVDGGPYTIIRHPQYLGFMLINLTFMISNPHWLCVLCGAAAIAAFYFYTRQEERRLRRTFGPDYAAYLHDVPGFNAPLGLLRWLRTRDDLT